MNHDRILVVDDEPDICALIKDILEDEGFEVDTAQTARDADSRFSAHHPNLVLLDIWMPGEDGISLLKSWQEKQAGVPVIVMSGHGTVETAVEATRLGAHSFIEKPLTTAKLLQNVHDALAAHVEDDAPPRIVPGPAGRSRVARRLRDEALKLAQSGGHLAIVGGPGVGKTTLGEYVHSRSARADKPFVVVHAGALDERTLADAIVQAGGGTLLIEHVAEAAPAMRRVIHRTLSGERLAAEGIRLMTTGSAEAGAVLEDAVQTVLEVAPLQDHVEDVPELIKSCTDYWCQSRRLPYRRFSIAAQNRLLHHRWPGNLGELNALVRDLLESGGSGEIPLEEVEERLQGPRGAGAWLEQALDKPMREAREMFEKRYLERHLELVGGNVTRLAAKIGMERTHLYRKLRSLGISLKDGGRRP